MNSGDGAASLLLARRPNAPGLLDGLRALDLTDEKGWLCSRILADLGVEVIKVEPPGGDASRRLGPFAGNIAHPERSLYWMAFNAGKKGVVLDFDSASDRNRFIALAKRVDFVIESGPPGRLDSLGLGYASLSSVNQRIVLASITPFGQTGPRRHYKASDITLMALSGMMNPTGLPNREPLRFALDQSYYHAGSHAVVGLLLARCDQLRTGQGQHVDVSIADCMLRVNYRDPIYWEFERRYAERTGSRMARGAVTTRMVWPCHDGYICWTLIDGQAGAKELHSLCAWIADDGIPGAERLQNISWEKLDLGLTTQQQVEVWEELMGRFFAGHSRQELMEGGIKRRMTIAAVNTVADVRRLDQLDSRAYWVELEHPELGRKVNFPGHFLLTSETTNTVRQRAPLIGEHTDEILHELVRHQVAEVVTHPIDCVGSGHQGAPRLNDSEAAAGCLNGVKVLDFTWYAAGTLATRYLSDYGAEVIKIESRSHPDLVRLSGPYGGGQPGVDKSALFVQFNTGKKSCAIDSADPRGLALIKRLIGEWADVVVENFSPGTMKRMGLGYEVLREIKPDVILVSSSSCGQAGVLGSLRGNALVASALGGHFYHTGYRDGEPITPSSIFWADVAQPPITASALLAAIDYRNRTGKGQWLDVAQIEVMAGLLAPALLDYEINGNLLERYGNRHPQAAPHGAFPCQGEDRWCAIAVFTDEEWRAFRNVMGDPAWADEARFATLSGRKENEDELELMISDWTRQLVAEEVMERLQARGVAAGVVQTARDLVDADPQVKARGTFVRLVHPVIGELSHFTPAVKLSRTRPIMRTSPLLGEHTADVCREVLGLSEEELAVLRESGVIA